MVRVFPKFCDSKYGTFLQLIVRPENLGYVFK
jgi:hypothetical protein